MIGEKKNSTSDATQKPFIARRDFFDLVSRARLDTKSCAIHKRAVTTCRTLHVPVVFVIVTADGQNADADVSRRQTLANASAHAPHIY